MTVRDTSREAYEYILKNGILAERQSQAYQTLYRHGPLTGKELEQVGQKSGLWKMCSVLKKKGIAIEVGKRPCRITGRNAYIWDVTSNYPGKISEEKRLTRAHLLKCRVILMDVWNRRDLPAEIREMISEGFR